MSRIKLVVAAALALSAGCAQRTMYDWGSYESSIQHMYAEGGNTHQVQDRQKLIDEVRKSELHNKVVPPGKYAQIGYLAWLSGDTAVAKQYFQAEKAAYPESAKFMDTLIGRLQ
jgi:hypothetical protein